MAEPRVWRLPPYPIGSVRVVRDIEGRTWRRLGQSLDARWQDDGGNFLSHTWGRLLSERGPVIEVDESRLFAGPDMAQVVARERDLDDGGGR